MKIYFARHGETAFNLHQVLMGHSGNEELNERGIEQAQTLAEKIQSENLGIEQIFCSPLFRARKTAMIVAEKINAPLTIKDELAERDYGNLEGQTYEMIEKETGHSFQYIEQHLEMELSKKFGAEAPDMLRLRLLHFLAEVKDKYKDKKVLAVTHKGIIMAMYAFFPQKEQRDINNASLHEFEI